jgi:enoyl-CoA hydratase/carnithine racemase
MDLSEIDKLNTEFSTRGVTGHIQDLLSKLESSPVPLISAINGLCFGGGLELVLCFHIVLATPSTKFSLPEIKLGTIPSYGGTQRLPRIIGRTRAFKLLLTGEIFSAELAHQWGLVTEIVSNDELLTTARHFAEMVSEFSRPAVASIIDCIVKGGDGSLRSGLSLESMESSKLAGGEDLLEGISAFFSKRKPSFPSTGKTKV